MDLLSGSFLSKPVDLRPGGGGRRLADSSTGLEVSFEAPGEQKPWLSRSTTLRRLWSFWDWPRRRGRKVRHGRVPRAARAQGRARVRPGPHPAGPAGPRQARAVPRAAVIGLRRLRQAPRLRRVQWAAPARARWDLRSVVERQPATVAGRRGRRRPAESRWVREPARRPAPFERVRLARRIRRAWTAWSADHAAVAR